MLLIVLVGGIVLMGGSCALCVCVGAASSDSGRPSKSSKAAADPPSDLPGTGEGGYVYYGKGDRTDLYLFRTLALAEKWTEAAAEHDTTKMAGLSTLGTKVPGGTRVKAIGGSLLYKEVRIEEGSHRGSTGWLAKDFVHRSRL